MLAKKKVPQHVGDQRVVLASRRAEHSPSADTTQADIVANNSPTKRAAKIGLCRHCGQTVVPPNPVPLPPLKARLFDLVRRHPGIQAETLRTLLWAGDPHGGPEDRKVLHVHVSQLNRGLVAPHGLRVRGSTGLGYRIERL